MQIETKRGDRCARGTGRDAWQGYDEAGDSSPDVALGRRRSAGEDGGVFGRSNRATERAFLLGLVEFPQFEGRNARGRP